MIQAPYLPLDKIVALVGELPSPADASTCMAALMAAYGLADATGNLATSQEVLDRVAGCEGFTAALRRAGLIEGEEQLRLTVVANDATVNLSDEARARIAREVKSEEQRRRRERNRTKPKRQPVSKPENGDRRFVEFGTMPFSVCGYGVTLHRGEHDGSYFVQLSGAESKIQAKVNGIHPDDHAGIARALASKAAFLAKKGQRVVPSGAAITAAAKSLPAQKTQPAGGVWDDFSRSLQAGEALPSLPKPTGVDAGDQVKASCRLHEGFMKASVGFTSENGLENGVKISPENAVKPEGNAENGEKISDAPSEGFTCFKLKTNSKKISLNLKGAKASPEPDATPARRSGEPAGGDARPEPVVEVRVVSAAMERAGIPRELAKPVGTAVLAFIRHGVSGLSHHRLDTDRDRAKRQQFTEAIAAGFLDDHTPAPTSDFHHPASVGYTLTATTQAIADEAKRELERLAVASDPPPAPAPEKEIAAPEKIITMAGGGENPENSAIEVANDGTKNIHGSGDSGLPTVGESEG